MLVFYMDLKEMFDRTTKTWRYNREAKHDPADIEAIYVALALGGEVGELQNLIKKIFRRKYSTLGHSREGMEKELHGEMADVLYHILRLSALLDIDLEKAFIEKMEENEKRYQ